jgi:hypothetical protein
MYCSRNLNCLLTWTYKRGFTDKKSTWRVWNNFINLFLTSILFLKLNSFYCLCFTGFSGTLCSVDVNECIVGVSGSQNMCQNNGTCFNTVGSYYCSCLPGYTGSNCGQLYDICLTLPCYRGTCHTYNNAIGSYYCECPQGNYFILIENLVEDHTKKWQ